MKPSVFYGGKTPGETDEKTKTQPFPPVQGPRVALAAIRGDKTLTELSEQFDVHANQIVQWKQQAMENLAAAFDKDAGGRASEADIKELHAKIGQLTLENDFLSRAFSKARGLNARR